MTRPFWIWIIGRIRLGQLAIELPSGPPIEQAGERLGPSATMRISKPGTMLRKVATGGGLGFAESYMDGDWETDDLAAVLEMAGRNVDIYVRDRRPSRLIDPARRLWQRATRRRRHT